MPQNNKFDFDFVSVIAHLNVQVMLGFLKVVCNSICGLLTPVPNADQMVILI